MKQRNVYTLPSGAVIAYSDEDGWYTLIDPARAPMLPFEFIREVDAEINKLSLRLSFLQTFKMKVREEPPVARCPSNEPKSKPRRKKS